MATGRGEYGCKECELCNASTAGSIAHKSKKLAATVGTFGAAKVARGFKKKCAVCGHPPDKHHAQVEAALASPAAPPQPAPTAAPAPPAPPQASADAPDLMEQLAKLGELRDAGVLTDDEFQAQKAKLLG